MNRYKVPTHIATPDKVLFGLTARQLLVLLSGAALAYQLWVQTRFFGWEHIGMFGIVLHALLSLPPLLVCLGMAFFTFADRPLEVWLLVSLHYRQQPKRYTWCSVKRFPVVPNQLSSGRSRMQQALTNISDEEYALREEV